MADLEEVAPAFVEMAHRIVWCSVATVDHQGRPRSRILHPFWEWDGDTLTGWIATGPTPTKRSHLAHSPFVSCSYWTDNHDTCTAECRADWHYDDATRIAVWNKFATAPRAGRLRPGDHPRVGRRRRRTRSRCCGSSRGDCACSRAVLLMTGGSERRSARLERQAEAPGVTTPVS